MICFNRKIRIAMNWKKWCFFVFLLIVGAAGRAQSSPVGVWKSVDDQTGEAKSHVEIFQEGNQYFGKIVKLLEAEPDTRCKECKGDKKDKPLIGMLVIENMETHKDYWKGGRIMDPETGNDYACSIWFEEGKPDELKVRGRHWTGIYRTQTWYRVK